MGCYEHLFRNAWANKSSRDIVWRHRFFRHCLVVDISIPFEYVNWVLYIIILFDYIIIRVLPRSNCNISYYNNVDHSSYFIVHDLYVDSIHYLSSCLIKFRAAIGYTFICWTGWSLFIIRLQTVYLNCSMLLEVQLY